MSSRRCAAKTCFNSQKSCPNLKFFTFPKDEKLCRQWAINCGREDLLEKTAEQLNKCLLCAEHFEPHWFINKYRTSFIRTGQPVPTIFYNNLSEFVPKSLKRVCELKSDSYRVLDSINAGTNLRNEVIEGSCYDDEEDDDLSETEDTQQSEMLHIGPSPEVPSGVKEPIQKRGCHKMCRLCACLVYEDKLISIFGDHTNNQHVMAMICKILPDKVHKNDGLPHHVCCSCVFKLSKCHQTVEAFLAADKKLRVLFESQSKSSQNLTYIKLEEVRQMVTQKLQDAQSM